MSEDRIVTIDNSDVGDIDRAGRVHVYNHNGDHLLSLLPSEPNTGGYFGYPSHLGENLIVVGDIGAEMNLGLAGLVRLYDWEGNYLRNISSPNPIVAGRFGFGVEATDDLLFISEYGASCHLVIYVCLRCP